MPTSIGRAHLLVDQRERFKPGIQHRIYESDVQVEGKEDGIGKVELERLEQRHLGDLLRRHLGLLDFGL